MQQLSLFLFTWPHSPGWPGTGVIRAWEESTLPPQDLSPFLHSHSTVPLQPPPAAGDPTAQEALLSLGSAQLEHAQLG